MASDNKRSLIAKTFVEMVRETSLDSIRVQDILERAGVSKSTFYRLFRDKYDVMSWVYLGPTNAIVAQSPDLANWKEWSYLSCEYIINNKKYFQSIISYSGQNSFAESLAHYFLHNIRKDICQKTGNNMLSEEMMFVTEAMSKVNAFAMIKWIKENCEWSIEVLVEYVQKCIPDCLKVFMDAN